MARLDLAADATARSFYLEQAPPAVFASLRFLHTRIGDSHDLREQRHLDVVYAYLAEVMREAIELRVVVESFVQNRQWETEGDMPDPDKLEGPA